MGLFEYFSPENRKARTIAKAVARANNKHMPKEYRRIALDQVIQMARERNQTAIEGLVAAAHTAGALGAKLSGAGGGGTQLTDAARGLLTAWHTLQSEHRDFLRAQEERLARHPALQGLLRRMSMKTSARNQFAGTVSVLDIGPVSAEVTITLKSGSQITATLTSAAARRLKLKKGMEALALIKASAVVLVGDFAGWQLSARNQLAGTVSRIEKGAVSSLVVLTLPGGAALSATVTQEGLDALGLKVGAPATAVFKAYAVMVATRP